MRALLIVLVSVITVPPVMNWLGKAGQIAPANPSHYVLRHGARSVVYSLVFLGFAAFILYVVSVQGWRHDTWIALLLVSVFGGHGLIVLSEIFFARIEVSPDGLVCRSPWRKTRQVRWKQIIGYQFSALHNSHILITQSSGKIRINAAMLGAFQLLDDAHRLGAIASPDSTDPGDAV